MKLLLCALAFLVTGALAAAPAFPLKVADNGRYLTDAKGAPFLYHADTGWRLFTDVTMEEALHYLDDRRAKGFTAIQSQLVVHRGEGKAVTREGIATFLDAKNEDIAQPNPAYFAHAEKLVEKAAERGLLMAMSSLWFGYKGTGYFAALDQAKARAFGRYLGERFKRFDNVIWMHGGDFRPGEKIEAVRELAAGLRETAPHHLQTFHNGDNTASTADFATDAWLDIDMVESVDPPETYSRVLAAYGQKQPHVRPVILGEPPYENERKTDAFGARSRAWWTMTSGAAGHAFGVFPVWRFGKDWQPALQSFGSQQMKHLRALLEASRWHELVPDEKNEIVTEGRGQFGSTDFVTVAATRDRKLALAYLPNSRAVTVDFAALRGPVRARWFDPTDGSFRNVADAPFSAVGKHEVMPPEKNNAAASDFVLVLETAVAKQR